MHRSFSIIGLIICFSLTAFAQKHKTPPPPDSVDQGSTSARSEKHVSRKSEKQSADAVSNIQLGTSIEAVLQSTLDTRKSQVGDEVVLKTTKAVKQGGEVLIPKGASLIGRVTEVQRKTKENAVSRLGMVFERAQGKNLDMPLNLSIVSVAAAQASTTAGDLFAGDVSTSGNARTTSSGGGGLLGGAGSTVSGVVNTASSTIGNVTGTAANTIGHTAGSVGRTINGLQIDQSLSGSANATSSLSAAGKDVKVDKGATFRLHVTGTAQKPE